MNYKKENVGFVTPEYQKHPFKVKCKNCGSENVTIIALESRDMKIKCESCGSYLSCGNYNPRNNTDYSEWYRENGYYRADV